MNIMFTDFVKGNGNYFEIIYQGLLLEQSNNVSSDLTNGIVVYAVVQIGNYQYQSNWSIVNCRYDVILGTSWHKDNQEIIDYKKQSLTVNVCFLPVRNDLNAGVKIKNIGAMKFTSLIRNHTHKHDFEIFQISEINNIAILIIESN